MCSNHSSASQSLLDERLSNLLASPDFSVPAYLNLALSTSRSSPETDQDAASTGDDEEELLQQQMASLALQLQIRTQSCHDEIGRIGAELQAIVPRCAADVTRLKVGLEGMEVDAVNLLEGMMLASSSGGEGGMRGGIADGTSAGNLDGDASAGGTSKSKKQSTPQHPSSRLESLDPSLTTPAQYALQISQSPPLPVLSTLHALRTHLSTTRAILAAASSWDETLSSLPSLLASQPPKLVEATQSLSRLEAGARALRGMPEGREDREAVLRKFRTQLEVLLKPQLLHALKRMDTRLGPLQQCVGMYRTLGKVEVLREEYVRMRPGEVVSLWFAFGGGRYGGNHNRAMGSLEEEEEEDEGKKKQENPMDGFYEGEESNTLEELKEQQEEDEEEEEDAADFDFSDDASKAADEQTSSYSSQQQQQQLRQQQTHPNSHESQSKQTANNPQQFIEWLPTWYEAVLKLLEKERRQARLVFGPELAPAIVARVLMECFRPIVKSMGSRLAGLCPVPGSGVRSGGEVGSLEGIAETYQSTVQFLSLAYDQMEAWDGKTGEGAADNSADATFHENDGGGGGIDHNANDAHDVEPTKQSSSSTQAKSATPASEALTTIRTSFLLVASPFRAYQRSLAEAERNPMGEAATMVAKDIRNVASGSAGAGLAGLEDAAERFGDLAPFMFPLADAAMTRFELLNSGYNAPATLTSIDTLLANHASELAIAMGTLSGNATHGRSGSGGGPDFDEQYVHCALEILRIAGAFKRNLRSFEYSVRDRLRNLANQMLDSALEIPEEKATAGTGGGTAQIPDSLDMTQIRTMLSKEACDPPRTLVDDGTGVKYPAPVVELRRLAGPSSKKASADFLQPPLFPKALDCTSRLARSCQSFVFEVCYAIPERHLRGISALPVWKQEGSGSGAEEDSYGILPQPFITQVGEHMLALVQALEPFASDKEALGLANEVMDGIREVAFQPWKEFVAAAGCSFSDKDEYDQLNVLMDGKELVRYFLDDSTDGLPALDQEDDEDEEDDPEEKATTAFCNLWLDVVGLAVTGRLLERTMRIPRLGRKGAEHLASDLNYIRNVFTALGVSGHPHPLLGYIAKLVVLDEDTLRSRNRDRQSEDRGPASEVIRRAELRVAYVRSISI